MKKVTFLAVLFLTVLGFTSAHAEMQNSEASLSTENTITTPTMSRPLEPLSSTAGSGSYGTTSGTSQQQAANRSAVLTSNSSASTDLSTSNALGGSASTGQIISLDRERNQIVVRNEATGDQQYINVDSSQFAHLSKGMKVRTSRLPNSATAKVDILSRV